MVKKDAVKAGVDALKIYNEFLKSNKKNIVDYLGSQSDADVLSAINFFWQKSQYGNAKGLSDYFVKKYPSIPEGAIVLSITNDIVTYRAPSYLNRLTGYDVRNSNVKIDVTNKYTDIAPNKKEIKDFASLIKVKGQVVFRDDGGYLVSIRKDSIDTNIYKPDGIEQKNNKYYYVFIRTKSETEYSIKSDRRNFVHDNPQKIYIPASSQLAIIPGEGVKTKEVTPKKEYIGKHNVPAMEMVGSGSSNAQTSNSSSYRPHQNTIFTIKSRMSVMDVDASNAALGE